MARRDKSTTKTVTSATQKSPAASERSAVRPTLSASLRLSRKTVIRSPESERAVSVR